MNISVNFGIKGYLIISSFAKLQINMIERSYDIMRSSYAELSLLISFIVRLKKN
jgi:hypothetical protein